MARGHDIRSGPRVTRPFVDPGFALQTRQYAGLLRRLSSADGRVVTGRNMGTALCGDAAVGGLLVTLVIAVTGIVASLPIGILLALGRRSSLPIVRILSTLFIEFWRGVPLITVLFFATYMLPLFLPNRWTIDALIRALIG